MATKTITKAEAESAKKELFALILKKTGISTSRFYEISRNDFVANNLDLLSPSERRHYKEIGLTL